MKPLMEFNCADMFCGLGGSTEAVRIVCRQMGVQTNLLAINHDEKAIAWHKRNHPESEHICDDLFTVIPEEGLVGKLGGTKLTWLVASPSCVQFSLARAGLPKIEQDRSTADCVVNWARVAQPDFIIVENVAEFMLWGPIHPADHPNPKLRLRPIKEREGETFKAWTSSLKELGYSLEYTVLRASDYGDATSRTRFFLVAVRHGSGLSVAWPTPTHADPRSNSYLPRWRTARDVLNLSDIGENILKRKTPLVKATLRRIATGLVNIAIPELEKDGNSTQFMTILRGQSTAQSLDKPVPTITTSRGHHYLTTAFITKYYGTGAAKSVDEPLDTLTTKDRFSIVSVKLSPATGEVCKTAQQVLVELMAGRRPIVEIRGELYQVELFHRMLRVREAADAMSFPPEFDVSGPTSHMKKFIGNAVPVRTVSALFRGMLEQVLRRKSA